MKHFKDKKQKTKVSKTMAYILRHKPDEFGIVLDPEGFTELTELASAIRQRHPYVTEEHVQEIVQMDEKQRYKISENMICANYGHSLDSLVLKYPEAEPPEILYHGTAKQTYEKFIKTEGIKKMNRLFVHLSADKETAYDVGSRHGRPFIIPIKAKQAWKEGLVFRLSENGTYLVDHVAPEYFRI